MTLQPRATVVRRLRVAGTIAALCASAFLASCGGSDDGPAPVTPPVASNTPPASAAASTDGFIAFLKTVVPTRPETTDPLDVTGFTAPVTEVGDPDQSI